MPAPRWANSTYTLIAATGILVAVAITVPLYLPQRPTLSHITLACCIAVYMGYFAWLDGLRKFVRESLPGMAIFAGVFVLAWLTGFWGSQSDSFLRYATVFIMASLLQSLFVSRFGKSDAARPATPSWSDVWAEIRTGWTAMPSWSEAQAAALARRTRPGYKTVRVKAPELAGTVEYDTMHFSGMRVQGYDADWTQPVSEVTTGDDGRFALPPATDANIHNVRVSWPGTEPVDLQVELTPETPRLVVHLRPQKPKWYMAG